MMEVGSCEKLAHILKQHHAVIIFINLTNAHDYQQSENQLTNTIPVLLRDPPEPLIMYANSFRGNNRLYNKLFEGMLHVLMVLVFQLKKIKLQAFLVHNNDF